MKARTNLHHIRAPNSRSLTSRRSASRRSHGVKGNGVRRALSQLRGASTSRYSAHGRSGPNLPFSSRRHASGSAPFLSGATALVLLGERDGKCPRPLANLIVRKPASGGSFIALSYCCQQSARAGIGSFLETASPRRIVRMLWYSISLAYAKEPSERPRLQALSPTVQTQWKIARLFSGIKSVIFTVAITSWPICTGALKLSVCEM